MRKISLLLMFLIPVTSEAIPHQKGIASWYGNENRISSSGKRLNKHLPAAAHRYLPLGSLVKVTSTKTKKSVIVLVEDRGPYIKNRIIDLNYKAAKQLGMVKRGLEEVILEKV